MSLIPLTVLLFIVMVALGGPEAFVNIVASFATDTISSTTSWIKHL
jgi:hypothetical protein